MSVESPQARQRRLGWLPWFLAADVLLLGGLFLGAQTVAEEAGRRGADFVAHPPAFQLVESLGRLGLKGRRTQVPGTPHPAWFVEGPKDRPPVLLVPGWGDGSTHLLAPYASWLAQERQVWVVDIPGQAGGAPGRVGLGPSESLAVGEAVAALARHHGGKISLMGLSMGGAAAIAAAAKHLDSVHALVTDGAFLRPASGLTLGLQASMGALGFAYLAQWGAQKAEGHLAQAHGVTWPAEATAEAAAPQLKGLPWFIVHGGRDHVVSPKDGDRLSKLGGGVMWTITQADHCSEPWASPLAIRGERYRQVVQQALNGEVPH